MRYLYLYFKIQKANVRARMMYPFNFFLGIFCVMSFGIFSTLFLWVLTQRFPVIVGWNFYEILFNASFNMFCYSLALALFIQLQDIDFYVRNAEFDRILVRPMNTLLQFACKRINLNGIGTVGYSLIVLLYAGYHVRDWDFLSLASAVLLIFCGLVTAIAIHLIIASISFITLQTRGFFEMKEVVYGNVCDYPLAVFSRGTQYFLSFIFPLAFIGFYPSMYLLGKTGDNIFGDYILIACVGGAFLLAILGYVMWNSSLRRYSGAGS
ncbi:ABC-2 family transporter protein [Paenibacillus sp.]|uniref:ABC transporter permease n=1 Tax=Paenibacillus sp. TaxID=58172 RepID=UPI00282BC8B1|nr:ABC-2 family transporter protein [Paenibacillus sp.]MDR0267456.1 ABC-2 family transporter protein [Paenibacillus sp.]